MSRAQRMSRKQLPLSLERDEEHPLVDPIREQVVAVLAELLLEALGAEQYEPSSEAEVHDECKDYE